MSYILDALRRADAERERGAVPGLHAQPDVSDLEPAARGRRPLLLAAAGAGMVLVAGAAIFLAAPWRGAPTGDARVAAAGGTAVEPPAPMSPAAPAPTAATPAPTPALATSPAPVAADATGAATAPSTTSIATLAPDGSVQRTSIPVSAAPTATDPRGAAPAAPATERAPAARGGGSETRAAAPARANPAPAHGGGPANARPSAPDTADANGAATPDARAAAAPAEVVEHYGPPLPNKAPPAATAQAPAPAVKNVNDLPPTLRAQMPRLAVGGAIYSDAPSGRMLILNGQVYHEGDHPTPDTLIEQIRLKSAVLSFRGTRYEITY
jgi:general secretion pathway protein B